MYNISDSNGDNNIFLDLEVFTLFKGYIKSSCLDIPLSYQEALSDSNQLRDTWIYVLPNDQHVNQRYLVSVLQLK